MRRALTGSGMAVVAAGVVALSGPPALAKAAPLEPCGVGKLGRCEVEVPLDRSGRVPGSVRLHVRRVATPGSSGGALFGLAGGPGSAASPLVEHVVSVMRRGLDGRDVVTFDPRGTGRSGYLRCGTLELLGRRLNVAGAAFDCAETLGPRRAFYTTRDSVEDLEAVRRAIGVEQVTLYGTSYGTKLALAYAAAYPGRVERLLLDSMVDTAGPDPFARDSLSAIPRVLRQLCDTRCQAITQDPAADLAALVSRMSGGPLRGPLVRDDGQVRPARMGRLRLADLLWAGDAHPTLRAALPGAVRSALNGDPAPILRLAPHADPLFGRGSPSDFSDTLFVATTCEEGPLPWGRTALPAARMDEARTLLAATPDGSLGPLDRLTAFTFSDVVQLCRLWPSAPAEPAILNGPFPAVPALVLAGEDDLRTPLETARAVTARLPQARLLVVPDAGHSVLSWFTAGCARTAARDFLLGKAIQGCVRKPRYAPPEPIVPTALSQLEPAPGARGRPGRTLAAVGRTLEDMGKQIVSTRFTLGVVPDFVPGLRGGTLSLKSYGLRLDRLEYVPGVTISGELRGDRHSRGFVRVSGRDAAHGRLRLYHGILSGKLGGRHVRLRLPDEVLGGEERPPLHWRGSVRLGSLAAAARHSSLPPAGR